MRKVKVVSCKKLTIAIITHSVFCPKKKGTQFVISGSVWEKLLLDIFERLKNKVQLWIKACYYNVSVFRNRKNIVGIEPREDKQTMH